MTRKISIAALLALASFSWGESAHATPDYPLVLDSVLGVRCPDPRSRCLICHTTSRGGEGTAEQVFALRMRDLGLNRGNDAGTLRNALMQLIANPSLDEDSDDDTTTDLEELRECGNPSGDSLGAGPEYGCDGAQLVPATVQPPGLALLAAGVATLIVRLGRRKRR